MQTIALFYPSTDVRRSRYTKRVCKRSDIDIEPALSRKASPELEHYPHWQRRLEVIRTAHKKAKLKKAKQLWFNRRDKTVWLTLWIGIIVSFLTVVTTITSILQVYASFKAINR